MPSPSVGTTRGITGDTLAWIFHKIFVAAVYDRRRVGEATVPPWRDRRYSRSAIFGWYEISRLRALLVIFLLLTLGVQPGRAEPSLKIGLVQDGQPVAAIVLAKAPTRAAALGAMEIQEHVRKITGATLPIVTDDAKTEGVRILIGESDATRALGLKSDDFKPQEYLIRFQPNTLVLIGRDKADTGPVVYDFSDPAAMQSWPGLWDERGTLTACYDFLERFCGVRWFDPTEFGTDIPTKPTLQVRGYEVRRTPAFRYRDATAAIDNRSERYDALVSLWAEDSAEFRAWEAAAYPRLHEQFAEPAQYAAAKRAWVRLFQLRMREGGELAKCNHSLDGYYARFWKKSPFPWLPEFVEKRPALFAQGYEADPPPQLCYTSPELIAQLAQDARDYFDGKKTSEQLALAYGMRFPNPFPIVPMDNDHFCKCPRCQEVLNKMSPMPGDPNHHQSSDYFYPFVNAVAKEVAKTHPQQRLIVLAYRSYTPPPSQPLEPNVLVEFCVFHNRTPVSPLYRDQIELLKRWRESLGDRPLYLWLYYTFPKETADLEKFHCFPGFFAHTIGEQMRLFQTLGVRGMFHCGYGQAVESYVTYKLMDDPSLDVDALLDEFFSKQYGPAGKSLKKFYQLVEQTYVNPANYPEDSKDGESTESIAWGYLGTEERMAQLRKCMEQAVKAADTALTKKRVALFEQSVWSYMAEGQKRFAKKLPYVEEVKALRKLSPPTARVARIAPIADGNLQQVDWSKAETVKLHRSVQGYPTERKAEARLLHDGKYIYLRFEDPTDAKQLADRDDIWSGDDWEVFVAPQRAWPFRQIGVNPSGKSQSLVITGHGSEPWDSGVKLSSAPTAQAWVACLSIPLEKLTPQGVKVGDKFYLNIFRGAPRGGGNDPLAWSPNFSSSFHEPGRLAEIVLE
ncbi:MAG: DUF4838 domain-containing protein [Verrucomicrobia bacterium]|nr:DUF4838 domain-containing protein [Verrucomicrobiota bacterium]